MMICPRCGIAFTFTKFSGPYIVPLKKARNHFYFIQPAYCPECNELIIFMEIRMRIIGGDKDYTEPIWSNIIFPRNAQRKVANEVPPIVKQEFQDAAAVLEISPISSALLSRRLLQYILRFELKCKHSSLKCEIEELRERSILPAYIPDQLLDVIREIGNLAAHPTEDKTCGNSSSDVGVEVADSGVQDGEIEGDKTIPQLVQVRPQLAEWLLNLLEDIFTYVYIQRKRAEENLRLANEDLKRAGRDEIK